MSLLELIRRSNRKQTIKDIERMHADISELEDLESKKTRLLSLLQRIRSFNERKKIEAELISVEEKILRDLNNIIKSEKKELKIMRRREKNDIKRAVKRCLEKHNAVSFDADSKNTFDALTDINAWMEKREAQYIYKNLIEEKTIEELKDPKVREKFAKKILQSRVNPSGNPKHEIRLGLAIARILSIYGLEN